MGLDAFRQRAALSQHRLERVGARLEESVQRAVAVGGDRDVERRADRSEAGGDRDDDSEAMLLRPHQNLAVRPARGGGHQGELGDEPGRDAEADGEDQRLEAAGGDLVEMERDDRVGPQVDDADGERTDDRRDDAGDRAEGERGEHDRQRCDERKGPRCRTRGGELADRGQAARCLQGRHQREQCRGEPGPEGRRQTDAVDACLDVAHVSSLSRAGPRWPGG